MIETLTKDEPITKPPTRWRNRWKSIAVRITRCTVCGERTVIAPGQYYESHCRTYPSRDVAETHATELFAPPNSTQYLGAFPVEES